jgi:molybdopterin biosynthesis enzyme
VPIEEVQTCDDGKSLDLRLIDQSSYKIGSWIRPIGTDIQKDSKVLEKGTILHAAELGLLATIGCVQSIKVFRKMVNIGILSTGNELVDAGIERLPVGKIRDSNKSMFKSILKELTSKLGLTDNVNVIDLGICQDNGTAIDEAVTDAISKKNCHVIITSGGVSMGELDLIKPYIE